jgi:hypothetical protein
LVKSLRHDWSPAELKSAIVTTAQSLNAEAMIAGGGRVDALRATSIGVTAVPSVLSFSRMDPRQVSWSAMQAVTLTNHSANAVTLSATVGNSPGVVLTIDPPVVSLAPGESRQVQVSLIVTPTALPVRDPKGSLATSGSITFTGAEVPIHLPWAFVQAALVTIDTPQLTRADNRPGVAMTTVAGLGNGIARTKFTEPPVLSAQFNLPPGQFDVETWFGLGQPDNPVVILERQRADYTAGFTILPSQATHSISYNAVTPEGIPLTEVGRASGEQCGYWSVILSPAEAGNGFLAIGQQSTRINDVSERYSFQASQTCWADQHHTAYIAQYAPVAGVHSDLDRTINPSAWIRQPVSLAAPPNLTKGTIGSSLSERGAWWYFSLNDQRDVPIEDGRVSATFYMNPDEGAEFNASAILGVPVVNDPTTLLADIGSMRCLPGGLLFTPFRTPTPMTYVAKPLSLIVAGEDAPYPNATASIDSKGKLELTTQWFGQFDNRPTVDVSSAKAVLRDENGTVVATNGGLYASPLTVPPGAYEMQFDLSYKLTGSLPGAATITQHFDTRRMDEAPPSLGGLRITDANGVVASQFARGSNGTLRFAAIDITRVQFGGQFLPALPSLRNAAASWRPHGATQWIPLSLRVEADDMATTSDEIDALGHLPIGRVFAADLATITQSAGAVDILVHVDDDSGNSMDYVMAPAFSVADSIGHQRAVRH